MSKKRTVGKAIQNWRTAMKACAQAGRLALLVEWSAVKVVPNSRRSLQEMRAAARSCFRPPRDKFGECWACLGWADLVRHHVIQLQHGGSNNHLNTVKICGECHAVIHPWLDMPTERTVQIEPVPF
jgi:5-methylcytosine-specific restriction endonuclease McrA